jgi:hypothetical protein
MSSSTPTCNICGCATFEDFRGRVAVRCTRCGSLERARMLALHLAKTHLLPNTRVLHIAPEEAIWRLLSRRPEVSDYVVADYTPELYTFTPCRQIDLCQLDEWPSCQFDLILHSHVLEHIRCNIAYTLFHLHRMLSPVGRHIFIVPFTKGLYEESFQNMSTDERTRRFGQWDHLRRFGAEDISDHLGKILRLPPPPSAENEYGRDALERANIPASLWCGWNPATVIDVAKNDYLLD